MLKALKTIDNYLQWAWTNQGLAIFELKSDDSNRVVCLFSWGTVIKIWRLKLIKFTEKYFKPNF